MKMMPLRYSISSWRQLVDVKSNNDPELKISVADFFQNDDLHGFRIMITHPAYGVLFSYILNARGTLITEEPYTHERPDEISVDDLLRELHRFGFEVVYRKESNLSGKQIDYLMTLNHLCFDKIRIINVWGQNDSGERESKPYVVGFQVESLGDWMNPSYSPSLKEFKKALLDGTAINITDISRSRRFDWDWLNSVMSIDDIIRDNTRDNIYPNSAGDYDVK